MKFQSLVASAFIGAALATPLARRQSDESDELENGPCKAVTFIFARGSTESGNMVSARAALFIERLKLTRLGLYCWSPGLYRPEGGSRRFRSCLPGRWSTILCHTGGQLLASEYQPGGYWGSNNVVRVGQHQVPRHQSHRWWLQVSTSKLPHRKTGH